MLQKQRFIQSVVSTSTAAEGDHPTRSSDSANWQLNSMSEAISTN